MNPYKYTVSFNLKHSFLSLRDLHEKFSKISGVILGRLSDMGHSRTTPNGQSLEGTYNESCFGITFMEEWQNSDAKSLTEALEMVIDKIAPFKDLLENFVMTGGKLYFFIGLGIDSNSGLILSTDLLKKLLDLNIELDFDMYPPDQSK